MSYSDYENSADFYSEVPDDCRERLDLEPILSNTSTDSDIIKKLIITNIFPENMPGITMRMINLPDRGCSVKAEPVFEYDEGELVGEISQIDPFIARMLETGKSFIIGNKHTEICARISIIRPDDIGSSRSGVLRTLTRKKISGRRNLIDK